MEIKIEGSTLFYNKSGNGSKVIFLFHGYGQDHTIFNSLTKALNEIYTCYSFDLYFHGNSVWRTAGDELALAHWKKVISMLLKNENINTFSLVGFSLGGKLALATLYNFPDHTEKIFLVAGEGLRKNFWYTFATATSFARTIFKRMVSSPAPFFLTLKFFRISHLVPEQTVRFAYSQMNSPEKRLKVYASWVLFRKFNFRIASIRHLCINHNIDMVLLAGSKDQLMKPSQVAAIQKRFPESHLEILNATHHGLLRALPAYIKSCHPGQNDNRH